MQITNRLRRAGDLNRVKARGAARTTLLALAALAVSACQDGFFFDPAQTRDTAIRVQYTFPEPAAAPAASGVQGAAGPEGPRPSPGQAFDKADAAQVVLRQGENELFNQRVALEAAGTDKKLAFTVELPAGSVVQASLSLTLLRGSDQIFTGTAQAQLTPGQSAEVTVPLAAVVSGIDLGGPYVIRTLGSTLKLSAGGLFATGDAVGTVSATFQALTSNVSVAADGTVTALVNGEGRVAATYLGRADTAVITVEDRCFGPFTNVAVGQTVNGALESVDCLDAANNTYNDWYFLTLAAPTLFRATMNSDGFDTFVGATHPAPPRRDLAVAANTGMSVISEHYFPAGSYLLRTGARANPSLPAPPTGSYSLQLTQASEPQQGCFRLGTSTGATWMLPGTTLSGRLAADDCQQPAGTYFDLYGVRFLAGDTGVVRLSGDFALRTAYGNDVRTGTDDGQPVWWAFTSEADQSHYVRIFSPGVTGNYDLRVDRGIPADYDACANPRINLPVGAQGSPVNRSGRLQRRIDCEAGDRVRDDYVVSAPAGPFRTTLESTAFSPFIVSNDGTQQKAGRANSTGPSVTAEHVYPAGQPYTIRVIPLALTSSGGPVEGAYTLTTEQIAEPQNGCPTGTSSSAFVDFGVTAQGRITPDDCRDLFAPDTATVTRWVDGYAILLQPGETVTATLTVDFPANFTRWVGSSFVEGHFGMLPGESRSFTVTQDSSGPAFHGFFPISGENEATGNYTITFSGGASPAPGRVAGAAASAAAELALPAGRGGSGPGR